MPDPDLALEIAKGVFAGMTATFLFVMAWIWTIELDRKEKRKREKP